MSFKVAAVPAFAALADDRKPRACCAKPYLAGGVPLAHGGIDGAPARDADAISKRVARPWTVRAPRRPRMNSLEELSQRIDRLEARLMYQDVTIETLNQTVTAQWQTVDALRRQLGRLDERLREAEARVPPPANEPPPHY